jgi:hypothetical protein
MYKLVIQGEAEISYGFEMKEKVQFINRHTATFIVQWRVNTVHHRTL